MPGRIGDRFGMDGVKKTMLLFVYSGEGEDVRSALHVKTDICENCGVVYAFRAD